MLPAKFRFPTAVMLIALSLSQLGGCVALLGMVTANVDDLGGKVLRMYAHPSWKGPGDEESSDMAIKGIVGYDTAALYYGGEIPKPEDLVPYRWTAMRAPGRWEASTSFHAPFGRVAVLVNEGVPLLKEGDWVDVYVPKKLLLAKRQWYTIIRRVCKAEDKACQKQEKARIGSPRGQDTGEQFDPSLIRYEPVYDMAGNWLPGRKPPRD